MKLMHKAAGDAPRRARMAVPLSVALSTMVLLGCRAGANEYEYRREDASPQAPYAVSPPAYKVPSSSPAAAPAASHVPQPSAPEATSTPAVAAPTSAQPSTCPSAIGRASAALEGAGYGPLAEVIGRRVAQESPKMKLTPQQGLDAACYALSDLGSMPHARALSSLMPKTTIELLRGVHERNVTREDAEGMADYLGRMLDSMRLSKIETFDECCSHVLGRRWSQIDYSGERLDPVRQDRHYTSRGVPDLLTAEHVRRYFEVESEMPYFRRLFRPQGPLPQ